MSNSITDSVMSQIYQDSKTEKTDKTDKSGNAKTANYGRTIGKPELSKEAEAYYQKLKSKYHNMDFILVSNDQKEFAKAQAASYANPNKMVVLIDEEKIERMAVDEDYRKQYEAIIANATSGLAQMKQSMGSAGSQVKGYGMQVNDGGLTSYFAVLKKSTADQKARIKKNAEKKKEAKKAEQKKAEKKEAEERLKGKKVKNDIGVEDEDEETITITANSLEELMQKISDYTQNEKMNSMLTDEEKKVGQNFDFRG